MSPIKMQDRVIDLISKDCDHREDRDINMVLPWLRKKSDVLKGLNTDVLKDVIRNCTYRRSGMDDVLIRQGDRGDCFFIMLSGRTSVFIDTVRSDEEGPPQVPVTPRNSVVNFDFRLDMPGQKKKPMDRTKFGKFIMHFDAGKSFGEIALISEDSIRNATIITDDDTDLLVISRDLFNRSIKTKQEEEYKERQSFVNTCPLFEKWSTRFRRLCEMSVSKEVHPFGSVIATQGQPSVGLVFIYRGQAKLSMEPGKHTSQYPKLMQQKSATIYKEHVSVNSDGSITKDSVTSNHIRIRRKQGYAAAERRLMSRYVNLCCVEDNEIVGDAEMVLELDTNIGTLTSTGDTVVFILNTKNYERLVQRKNPHTAERLKAEVHQKLCGRLTTTPGAQIPLLKNMLTMVTDMLPSKQQQSKKGHLHRKRTLLCLIDMFLKDKCPFIQPFVPDSLYYRKLSSDKANRLISNARHYRKITRNTRQTRDTKQRLPRSIGMLKNNVHAEQELLGYKPVSAVSSRPMSPTSTFVQAATLRPHTATGSVTITRCDVDYEFGQSAAPEQPPDRDLVVGIFEEMELYQKGKSEERSRMVTSAFGKRVPIKLAEEEDARPSSVEVMQDEDGFFDWETSDSNLSGLENRIQQFCNKDSKSRLYRGRKIVSQMKRFEIEQTQFVPIPGGSVFVHKKPCQYPSHTPINPALHQHVRRFMLSRQTQHAGTNTICFRTEPQYPGGTQRNQTPAILKY